MWYINLLEYEIMDITDAGRVNGWFHLAKAEDDKPPAHPLATYLRAAKYPCPLLYSHLHKFARSAYGCGETSKNKNASQENTAGTLHSVGVKPINTFQRPVFPVSAQHRRSEWDGKCCLNDFQPDLF